MNVKSVSMNLENTLLKRPIRLSSNIHRFEQTNVNTDIFPRV